MDEEQELEQQESEEIKQQTCLSDNCWWKIPIGIVILFFLLIIENNRLFLGFAYKYITGEIRVDEGDVTTLLQVIPIVVVSYLGYRINQKMYVESEELKVTSRRVARVKFNQLAYENLTKLSRIKIFWKYRLEGMNQDDFESDDLIEYYQYYLDDLDQLNDLSKKRQEYEIELIKVFGDRELFEILTNFSFNEDVFINVMNRNRDILKASLKKNDTIDSHKDQFLYDLNKAIEIIIELEKYSEVIKEASSRMDKLMQ